LCLPPTASKMRKKKKTWFSLLQKTPANDPFLKRRQVEKNRIFSNMTKSEIWSWDGHRTTKAMENWAWFRLGFHDRIDNSGWENALFSGIYAIDMERACRGLQSKEGGD
jgi:hypothetical protein